MSCTLTLKPRSKSRYDRLALYLHVRSNTHSIHLIINPQICFRKCQLQCLHNEYNTRSKIVRCQEIASSKAAILKGRNRLDLEASRPTLCSSWSICTAPRINPECLVKLPKRNLPSHAHLRYVDHFCVRSELALWLANQSLGVPLLREYENNICHMITRTVTEFELAWWNRYRIDK